MAGLEHFFPEATNLSEAGVSLGTGITFSGDSGTSVSILVPVSRIHVEPISSSLE